MHAITPISHYYPFGLKHQGYNTNPANPKYQYKYQGQERQIDEGDSRTPTYAKHHAKKNSEQTELNLNWDSFKWRNYDYAIGRFMSVDPLSENYSYQSHYNFSENRVIDARELEGLESVMVEETKYNIQHTWSPTNKSKNLGVDYIKEIKHEYRDKTSSKGHDWFGRIITYTSATIDEKGNVSNVKIETHISAFNLNPKTGVPIYPGAGSVGLSEDNIITSEAVSNTFQTYVMAAAAWKKEDGGSLVQVQADINRENNEILNTTSEISGLVSKGLGLIPNQYTKGASIILSGIKSGVNMSKNQEHCDEVKIEFSETETDKEVWY